MSLMSFTCSILTPINLYTTPLLNSWQQFSPPEICNHTYNSRLRHSAQAEAKVVLYFLLSKPFYSGVTLLHSSDGDQRKLITEQK